MENSAFSQIFYGNSQKSGLGGESQYCQGDTDDEDCPVPAAPGGEDFLPLTQLDPFIDFQPSQIFHRSQNGAPNENRGKEPPNIATPVEKTKLPMTTQAQRRQLFKPPEKISSPQSTGKNNLNLQPKLKEHPSVQSAGRRRLTSQAVPEVHTDFTFSQPSSNVQIVSPSAVPAIKSKFYTPTPLVLNQGENAGVKLKSTEEIAERYRSVFPFPYFNIVQTKVFDEVFYKDSSLVVCAPTGSGKTVVFELAIIRLLMKPEQMSLGANFKIVYMAPIKALCSERCSDWTEKLEPLGLRCRELTGDSVLDDYYQLQRVNIIFTTPEKWDSMTRRWRDNAVIMQSICLFLIDEIHVLSDATRGATMEAVVSRMKTIQAAMNRLPGDSGHVTLRLRFVAVSATIPNISDIAEWLGDKEPAVTFNMGDNLRPVRLRKVVLGFPFDDQKGSDFQFDMSLSYRLARIINTYSDSKPTLVFCSTRKSTQQAAEILVKDLRSSLVRTYFQRQALQTCANSLKDNKLRDLVAKGVGYHHAGLDVHDRKAIEEIFLEGQLMVLVATSTLAMGVNLPAHLVVLKSTSYYNLGVHVEYSDTQILQMIGRAGRPQFDTTATAVIMTKNQTKEKYESLVNGTQLIESSLHKNLIEHLNAEIVLHTINDISVAMEWIRYTFLYIRVMKNPRHYGMPTGMNKEQTEKRLQELCMRNLNLLNTYGMITMDEETIDVKSTEPGRLMARYCIAFDTMKRFSKLGPDGSISELLYELCGCEEFAEVQLRNNEKKILNTFNKDKNRVTVRYPITGKVKTKQMKVYILIQVALGCLQLQDFSLQQDTTRIFRAAQRMSRCLVELLWLRDEYRSLLSAVLLMKCLKARLWDDSRYVSKQLDGIGPALSNALVNAGVTTFQKISETNPRELELIVNRHPPFGNQLRDMVTDLPKYELTIEQVSKYSEDSADIVVHLVLANPEQISNRRTLPENHTCVLLIGDENNKVIYNRKVMDAYLLKEQGITKKLEIIRCDRGPNLFIHLISQEWVGLDVQSTYTPYYIGAKKLSNIPTSVESGPVAQPTRTPQLSQGMEECGHRCVNKSTCAHDCCRNGVMKRKPTKTRPKTPLAPKTRPMDNYVNSLKDRVSQTPNVAKRLKMTASDTFGRDFDLTRFAYNVQPKRAPSTSIRQKNEETREINIPRLEESFSNFSNLGGEQTNDRCSPLDNCNDWMDLDEYVKHKNTRDSKHVYVDDQYLDDENETGMEEYSEFGDGWSKVPPRPVSTPAPRFGQVLAWSNDKENVGPSYHMEEKHMSQRNSSFPWTLNQNTLKALSCSKENTLKALSCSKENTLGTKSFASPWYSGNNEYNQHTDASQGQDCYIVEQNLNVNQNQRIGSQLQQRQAKDSWCYRNDSHGIIKDVDTFKFKKRGYREYCGEEETEQFPVMFDRVTSPATVGDWSGSDSDLLILDLPSPRETTQHASTPETTPFSFNYPVKGSKQDLNSCGANYLEKSENFRKAKEASHCASTPESAFSLNYPDKGNSYGSNYSEKSEKLRKAEREMELFLFGCAGCPTMAAKENISPNKRDEINGNIKFMENSNVSSIDTTPECEWRNSDESTRKIDDVPLSDPKMQQHRPDGNDLLRPGTFSSIFDSLF
ncbi:putative ATP-dependent DNA helicase HFM1 isoform X2 [Crassostrea virginica]